MSKSNQIYTNLFIKDLKNSFDEINRQIKEWYQRLLLILNKEMMVVIGKMKILKNKNYR